MKSAVLKQKLVNVILEMTSYIRLDFRKLGIHKKHSFSLRFYLASVEVLQNGHSRKRTALLTAIFTKSRVS